MNCVFAHAAYGVILPQQDQDQLNRLLDERRDERDAEGVLNEEVSEEDLLDEVMEREHPTLLHDLRLRYKSGMTAGLIYTGSEDDHFAGSATPAELWIFGYGCLAFPEVRFPTEFQVHADWHFWVTGEV